MTTIWLDLPMPPSVNEMTANSENGGRHSTKKKKDWTEAAGWTIRAALSKRRIRSIVGPYELHCYVNESTPGDITNREKALSDLLVSQRVTDDDRHMDAFSIRRVVDVQPGRIVVAASTKRPGIAHCPPHDLT